MDPKYVYIVHEKSWQAEANGKTRTIENSNAVFNSVQGANNFAKTCLYNAAKIYRQGELLKKEEQERPSSLTEMESRKEKQEMLYYGMVVLREEHYAPWKIVFEVRRLVLRNDVPPFTGSLLQDTTMHDEISSSEDHEDQEDTNTSVSSEANIKPHMRSDPQAERSTCLAGLTFAFTGRPHKLDRAEEMSMVHRHGGVMVRLTEVKELSYLVRSLVGNGMSEDDEEMIGKLRPVVVDKVGLKRLVQERIEGGRKEEVGRKRRRVW